MNFDVYFDGHEGVGGLHSAMARRSVNDRGSVTRASLAAMSDQIAASLAAAARRRSVRVVDTAAIDAEVRRLLTGAAGKALAMSREGLAERSYEFRAASVTGDGGVLEGYAAVFDAPARIRSWDGDFTETIRRGAFADSIAARTPVLQFDHGRDARVGSVPIGSIEDLREDDKGLYVFARLFDNDVVLPVRQAIAGKAIRGMSFRFEVPDGGDRWSRDKTQREIHRADVAELGPVVFPAYDTTSVTVRLR